MRYTAWILLFLAAGLVHGESAEWTNAYDLYQRTQYEKSLAQLVALKEKDAAVHQLIGRNYYMLAEYKKATDALEKANDLKPNDSETLLWLGRAWGRRAETAS